MGDRTIPLAQSGKIGKIGLSNHSLTEIKEAADILAKEGLKISAIQNHYSLLNRSSETSGILDYCKENDSIFFSYMVLEQGALTGKYNTEHPFPEDSCEQAVKDAIDLDYRLIDTASSYQNEKAVGRAIASCDVPRKELFITTEAYIQQMGYEKTKQAFQESLDNLGLKYLDLYLIHMPFGDYYGSWKVLEELYREGKVRAIGVCNFLSDRLLDLCYNSKITPLVDQIERHPYYQRKEDLEIMRELKVQPQAWAPFTEGLKGMFDEPILKEIAKKYNKTVVQIILRWNVQQGVI